MKKLSIAAILLAATGAGSAQAADLPSMKAPPPPPPPVLWTGFYGGLNIGGAWSDSGVSNNFAPVAILTMTAPTPPQCQWWCWGGNWGGNWAPVPTPGGGVVFFPTVNSSSAGGVGGGGQIGYNYQLGVSFLIGVEADFQGTSIGSFERLPWFGTVRGRAGYLFTPTLLIYGAGGFAYGEVDHQLWGISDTRTGWTAGGGLEWMFTPNWSAKVEYLHVDLSGGGWQGNWGWNWGWHDHPQINLVRVGVNYHFNWGAPAPVVAKY
ncbi:MAG TPA: outer membrane beta-barrel protein [Methylocystis sp.]|nr:outer membrane beta-barrel protein [Methylocystis sp.]